MLNHITNNKAGQIVTILLTLAFFLSACSGGNLPQVESSQLNSQLQAKQNFDGQGPAKQTAPDVQPVNPADGSSQPLAAEKQAQGQPAAALPVEPAPALAEAAAQAAAPAGSSADAAPNKPPAVDLSIPAEPKVGFRAPDFALQTLAGGTVRLSDLVGRPVVISYWATWCIPCQKELPILEQLSQEYQSQGLVIVTVNAIDQDSTDKVQAMIGEKNMTLPVLLDQGDQFASTYGALFFPTTFFVDANGVIRYIRLGDSSEADLRSKVESLLAGVL